MNGTLGPWHLLAAALTMMAGARLAQAQGTQRLLPDPIAGARLSQYADLLKLSPQQRHALEDLHATYRELFQELRDGEIDAWLKTQRSGTPPRSYFVTQHNLQERIAALDNRLFDSTLPIVTDVQAAQLARVRRWRERERIVRSSTANDASLSDLTEKIMSLSLSSEQWEAIDPTLTAYESEATQKLRQLVDFDYTTQLRIYDAYAKHGYTDGALSDPANKEALIDILRHTINVRSPEHFQLVSELRDLNRRTITALMNTMPPEPARRVWVSFVATEYDSVGWIVTPPSPFADALARDDLKENERIILQQGSEQLDRNIDKHVKPLIAQIYAHRAKYGPLGLDYDQEKEFNERNEMDQAVREASQEVAQLRTAARKRIEEVLGSASRTKEDLDPETMNPALVGPYSLIFGRSEISPRLPPAISGWNIAQFAAWLGADQDEQDQLHFLHARYLEQFALLKARYHEMISNARDALYAGDTIEGFTNENLRRYRQAETEACSAQRVIEDAFFADLQQSLLVEPDNVSFARVKNARQLQWLNSGVYDSQTQKRGGCWHDYVDLSSILYRMHNLDLREPGVDRVLAQYEQALLPLLTERHKANRAYTDLDDQLRIEFQTRQIQGREKHLDMIERSKAADLESLRAAAKRANAAVGDLNRATLDQLLQVLPKVSATRVRHTCNRLFWPRIYGDRSCASPWLTSAIGLHDLTEQQRSEIENIAAEYYSVYDELCCKMVLSIEPDDSPFGGTMTEAQWKAWNERRSARLRLQFDRHELSVRVGHRLKGILSEVQARAIGLPEPLPLPDNSDFGS